MGKGACLLEPCIKSSKGSHLLPDASGTPPRCPRACTMQGTMSTACKATGDITQGGAAADRKTLCRYTHDTF